MHAYARRPVLALAAALLLAGLACGRAGGRQSAAQTTAQIPPTPTPVPTPAPPVHTPEALPGDSDLRQLINYANAMAPLLEEAGIILQRDGAILQAADDGDDQVLCDGRLQADNQSMKAILTQVGQIRPPSDAAAIHDLMLRSGEAWTEALDNVEKFCDTGNQFYKVPAAIKFWEAALLLQDAGNRFWMLVMAEGIQDWVRR